MRLLNIPNILSLLRCAGSFVYLFFAIQGRWEIAFPIFVVAALTDMIDGTIARLMKQRTQLGAFLDPAADKLLMFFGFISLTVKHLLPVTLTGIVIARDLLITVGVLILRIKKVRIVFSPTYLSKLTTFFQILTIFSALLQTQQESRFNTMIHGKILTDWLPFFVGMTALLTLVTALQYLQIGIRMLREK